MEDNNGKKPRKAGRIFIRLFPVILLLALIGIVSIPRLSARFRSGGSGGDGAKTAKFNVYVSDWKSDSEGSDSGSYSFRVNNGSEVKVAYSCTADWYGSGQVDVTFDGGTGTLSFGESSPVKVTYVRTSSDSSGSLGVNVIATQVTQ